MTEKINPSKSGLKAILESDGDKFTVADFHHAGFSIKTMTKNCDLFIEAFNVANETGQTPLQLKERLEKTNNHLTDLVWLFEHGATSEEIIERIGIINTFLSEQTKKQ